MKLKNFIKRVNEISSKNRRERVEYFSLLRDLNSLSNEEKRALIAEIQQDDFINVELREVVETVKALIAELTGVEPNQVKLEKFMRRRIVNIEYIKIELNKAMEDDLYLGTFGIAVVDMYLDANELYSKIYKTFRDFDLWPDLHNPNEED